MDYPRVALTDIDLRALTPHTIWLKWYGTQDHCRWVLTGSEAGKPGTLYYKIWNPTYVSRDNIVAAVEAGFYDERTVPALQALVFHKGLCRGYVMSEGDLRPEACDDEFRALVYARTVETGYFAIQFGRNHTMVYGGRPGLLDIEGVYPLEALPRLPDYHSHMDDTAYARVVASLYRQSLEKSGVSRPDFDDVALPPARNAVHRFLLLRWRRGMVAMRKRLPRFDLIQY